MAAVPGVYEIPGNAGQLEVKADGTRIKHGRDGNKIMIKPDGSKTQWKPDGTYITVNADGSKKQMSTNGTVQEVDVHGTIRQTNPNGTIVEMWKNGHSRQTNTDGVIIDSTPDKKKTIYNLDGSRDEIEPDGQRTIFRPDGTRDEMKPNGICLRNSPDGSIVEINATTGVMIQVVRHPHGGPPLSPDLKAWFTENKIDVTPALATQLHALGVIDVSELYELDDDDVVSLLTKKMERKRFIKAVQLQQRHSPLAQQSSGKSLLKKAWGDASAAPPTQRRRAQTIDDIKEATNSAAVYIDEQTGHPYTVDPVTGETSWLEVKRDKSFKRTKTSTYYKDEGSGGRHYKVNNSTGDKSWVRAKSFGRSKTGSDIYVDDESGLKYKHNETTGETEWLDENYLRHIDTISF